MTDEEWEELANEFPGSFIAQEWTLHQAWQGMRPDLLVAFRSERLYCALLWLAGMLRRVKP